MPTVTRTQNYKIGQKKKTVKHTKIENCNSNDQQSKIIKNHRSNLVKLKLIGQGWREDETISYAGQG